MNSQHKPSLLPLMLLKIFIDNSHEEGLFGDLLEEYNAICIKKGVFYGKCWIWLQCGRSSVPLFLSSLYQNISLMKNTLKVSYRSMMRQKIFSLINITGLALALACCLAIIIWVQDELCYDSFHKHKSNIYRLVADWPKYKWGGYEGAPDSLAYAAKTELPDVTHAAVIIDVPKTIVGREQNTFYESGGIVVSRDFFNIFTFPIIKGSIDTVFSGPNQAAISEDLSARYFGLQNPIGKELSIAGENITVNAVFKNVPEYSHIQFDMVFPYEFGETFPGIRKNQWSAFNYVIYCLLEENGDPVSAGKQMTDIAEKNGCNQVIEGAYFYLQPLDKVYLDGRSYVRGWMKLGDRRNVLIFTCVAALVLLIACINFVNLTNAQSSIRTTEVGIRKTMGASRIQLIRQFFSESVFLVMLSFIAGLMILEVMLPAFNKLSGKELTLSFGNGRFLLSLLGMFLVTGLLAGTYPAFFMSSLKPLSILNHSTERGRQGKMMWGILTVVQFSMSVVLIVVTLSASRQMNYIKNKQLGFNKEHIIQVPLKGNVSSHFSSFRSELLSFTDIRHVSAQSYLFTETNRRLVLHNWEGLLKDGQGEQDIIFTFVEDSFFETLEIPLAAGSPFYEGQPDESIIINQQAAREMGMKAPLGKWVMLGDTRVRITGVIKDTLFNSLHQKVSPQMFLRKQDWSDSESMGSALIKTNGSHLKQTLDNIQLIWHEMNPDIPFEYSFMDSSYQNLYKKEMMVETLLRYFTMFAILISCIGLYGVSTLVIEQRKKEVGIRKILGASTFKVVLTLSGKFIKWIIAANVLSIPVSYLAVNSFLNMFAYRVPSASNVFLIAAVITVSVGLFTIGIHVYRAATKNPVFSLKYE